MPAMRTGRGLWDHDHALPVCHASGAGEPHASRASHAAGAGTLGDTLEGRSLGPPTHSGDPCGLGVTICLQHNTSAFFFLKKWHNMSARHNKLLCGHISCHLKRTNKLADIL